MEAQITFLLAKLSNPASKFIKLSQRLLVTLTRHSRLPYEWRCLLVTLTKHLRLPTLFARDFDN